MKGKFKNFSLGFIFACLVCGMFFYYQMRLNYLQSAQVSVKPINNLELSELLNIKKQVEDSLKAEKILKKYPISYNNELVENSYISDNSDIIVILKNDNSVRRMIWMHPTLIDQKVEWKCFSSKEVMILSLCD